MPPAHLNPCLAGCGPRGAARGVARPKIARGFRCRGMRFLPGHLYNCITTITYYILIIRLAETGFLYSVRRFPPATSWFYHYRIPLQRKSVCETAFRYNRTPVQNRIPPQRNPFAIPPFATMKPPCETAFRFNETAGLWPGGNRIEKIAGKSPSDVEYGLHGTAPLRGVETTGTHLTRTTSRRSRSFEP